uniref:Uncharacterized protein n=1 Tax=Arundo donax TaxID=35708 RepID=A0A0A9DZF5_ARUDO
MPVRSPRARAGSWCTQPGSGHTYTFLRPASLGLRCFSFQGRLCPRRCSCRFWSRWNPLPHTSHTYRFVAIRVRGDSAITSASGSGFPGTLRFFLAGGGRGWEETLAWSPEAEVRFDMFSSAATSCCCC